MFKVAYKKRKLKKGENPRELYERLHTSHSFLLESGKDGRYSFIGYEPFIVLVGKDDFAYVSQFEYKNDDVKHTYDSYHGDVFELLRQISKGMEVKEKHKDLPPFIGGAAGFFSYDYGLGFENLMTTTEDDLMTPDMYFSFVDKVVVFDHEKKELFMIALGDNKKNAEALLEKIELDVKQGSFLAKEIFDDKSETGQLEANLPFDEYKVKLETIKDYINDGDTYQVNFAQRFQVESDEDPWKVYQRLTSLNPSPHGCFFDGEQFAVVSCSPEELVSVRDAKVKTSPIKGTVRRGKNEKEDKKNIEKLLASEKDNAELSMIVDLARNDLGKVCEKGSVKVTDHRKVIKYSHVIHTVSQVEGKLKKNKDNLDVIRSLFPGGSITGCPKKRTMEIIGRLEDFHRGVYCGSAGYLSVNGNMDFNIMIRTLYFADDLYTFHSGGGIVLDSDADSEYQEALDKAEALKQSLF